MLDTFVKYVAKEWRLISETPFSFGIAVLVLGTLIFFGLRWRYAGVIDGKDSEISLQDRQLRDYKDRLDGASPKQAEELIQSLEARLAVLEPRKLTVDKRRILMERLALPPGKSYVIEVAHDGACADCDAYASGFAGVFSEIGGWTAVNSMVLGISGVSRKGLTLFVRDPKSPPDGASILIQALNAAKIDFETLPGKTHGAEMGLIITTRASF
jgi:hypothetical protein